MSWDGVDRRGEDRPSDVVYALSKINEKFIIIENNAQNAVNDIEELKQETKQIVAENEKKHIELEKRIYQNIKMEMHKILNKLEILVSGNENNVLTFNRMENRIGSLEDRTKKLEDGPKQKIYEVFIAVAKKIGWVLLFGIGAMVMYALQNGYLGAK